MDMKKGDQVVVNYYGELKNGTVEKMLTVIEVAIAPPMSETGRRSVIHRFDAKDVYINAEPVDEEE